MSIGLPTPRGDLTCRDVENDVIVIDERTSVVHHLVEDHAEVWRSLREGAPSQLPEPRSDAAIADLMALDLLTLPSGMHRRAFMQRSGLVGSVAIATLTLGELPAFASGTTSGTLRSSGTFTIPAPSRSVVITLYGAIGGASRTTAGGLSGTIIWKPGDTYTSGTAITFTFTTGSPGVVSSQSSGGAGGPGFLIGGKGQGNGGNGSGGGGGGGSTGITITSAANNILEAAGGGGAGGDGNSTLGGKGGDGGNSAPSTTAGTTANGVAGTNSTNLGGAGGGTDSAYTSGNGATNITTAPNKVGGEGGGGAGRIGGGVGSGTPPGGSGGGGGGQSSIGPIAAYVAATFGAASPGDPATATLGSGYITYSYIS